MHAYATARGVRGEGGNPHTFLRKMTLKDAICLIVEVENMPIWVERPGHALVGDS